MRRITPFELFLILAIIAVLAGNIYLFFYEYRPSLQARAEAEQGLVVWTQRLTMYQSIYSLSTLQARLNSIVAQLPHEPPVFPERTPILDVDVADLVIQSAETAGVSLRSFEPLGVYSERLGTSVYQAASYHVEASGQLANLNDFLGEIEGGDFTTLRIMDIEITFSDGTYNMGFDIIVLIQRG